MTTCRPNSKIFVTAVACSFATLLYFGYDALQFINYKSESPHFLAIGRHSNHYNFSSYDATGILECIKNGGRDVSSRDCNSKWPSLDLLVTMPKSSHDEFMSQLWPSLQAFWPRKYLNLIVVLDKEENYLDNYVEKLKLAISSLCNLRIHFNEKSPYFTRGKDRQQLVMFWADNYTTAEYVGFVDTDTVFISPVENEDLFENDKPVIFGFYGKPQNDGWAHVPAGTWFSIKKLEVMRCMSYFPVIIRTKYLPELRQYVASLHNMTFNEVFREMWRRDDYGQFNIMCNYLWHFHREEYSWYVQEVSQGWNGQAPPGQIPNISAAGITSKMLNPKSRAAIHWTYRTPKEINLKTVSDVIKLGHKFACKAVTWNLRSLPIPCDYHSEHLSFEFIDWSWHNNSCAAVRKRYEHQGRCLEIHRVLQSCLYQ